MLEDHVDLTSYELIAAENLVTPNPVQQYQSLMATVRQRLDLIDVLRSANLDAFSRAETVAFHGRKVVEGIAFGCLVAVENGLKYVPRDVKGQWNAGSILKNLSSKKITVFPNPSIIRTASESERTEHKVQVTVEGIPERCLTHDDLRAIYDRFHKWLHEINPYVETDRAAFITRNESSLWEDISKLHYLVARHFIAIGGHGFFCTLRDSQDGLTKVVAVSRPITPP